MLNSNQNKTKYLTPFGFGCHHQIINCVFLNFNQNQRSDLFSESWSKIKCILEEHYGAEHTSSPLQDYIY